MSAQEVYAIAASLRDFGYGDAPREQPARRPPRPPDRIDAVLLVVRKFWEKNPDLRLGQLIGNAANQINCDPYAMEDDRLLAALWETWSQ